MMIAWIRRLFGRKSKPLIIGKPASYDPAEGQRRLEAIPNGGEIAWGDRPFRLPAIANELGRPFDEAIIQEAAAAKPDPGEAGQLMHWRIRGRVADLKIERAAQDLADAVISAIREDA